MRFGIISDIHANWPAFQVVLAELEKLKIDEIVCLGDVIGYYAEPAECLDALMKQAIPSIKGNHERMVVGELNPDAKEGAIHVIEYTRNQLSEEHMEFVENAMKNKRKHGSHFLMVHGSPRHKDEYLLKMESFVENLKILEEKYPDHDLCFHGHTHKPSVIGQGHLVQSITEDRIVPLQPGTKYLINPGSVGQPRDGCPLTSFAVYDDEDATVSFYRREYDIEATIESAREAMFPTRLITRLREGR